MIGPEQDEDLGCNLGVYEGVHCVETLADVQRRKYFCVTMPKTNAKTPKLSTASKELAPIYHVWTLVWALMSDMMASAPDEEGDDALGVSEGAEILVQAPGARLAI